MYLHRSLRFWAETYRDGIRGKEQIVAKEAIGNLWALGRDVVAFCGL